MTHIKIAILQNNTTINIQTLLLAIHTFTIHNIYIIVQNKGKINIF